MHTHAHTGTQMPAHAYTQHMCSQIHRSASTHVDTCMCTTLHSVHAHVDPHKHTCTHTDTCVCTHAHRHTHTHTGVWLPSIPRSVFPVTNGAFSRILTSACSIQAPPLSLCPSLLLLRRQDLAVCPGSVDSEGQGVQEPRWLHEKGAVGQPLGAHRQVQVGRTRQAPRTVTPGPTSVSPLPLQAADVARTHSHHFSPTTGK